RSPKIWVAQGAASTRPRSSTRICDNAPIGTQGTLNVGLLNDSPTLPRGCYDSRRCQTMSQKTMGNTLRAGVCLLALFAVSVDGADAARRMTSKCANVDEVSALQTAAVQQELMDAALGCGPQSVQKF